MKATDFVYKSVFSGSLKAGADNTSAHQQAVMALDNYRKSKNQKPGGMGALIEYHIKQAVKLK